MGVDAEGQPPALRKKKIAKKPIGKDLDGCNIGRHKLRKITVRLGTLNVKGIRNKIGEIIKGLEELKQDITILTETKNNGSGKEILGRYSHIIVDLQMKIAKRGVSILVKKIYKLYIISREASNENTIKLHTNQLRKKLCTVL